MQLPCCETDKLNSLIPLRVFALALRERGETDGFSYQEQMRIADRALQDAISIDANKYPEEQDFYRI